MLQLQWFHLQQSLALVGTRLFLHVEANGSLRARLPLRLRLDLK